MAELLGEPVAELIFDGEELSPSSNDDRTPNCLVRTFIMFLLMWQALFRLSDTGMNILLLFITKFLSLTAITKSFIDQLPQTVSAAKKVIGVLHDNFSKYACCPVCHTVYPLDMCKVMSSDKTVQSRCCSHIKFPNHPHAFRRRPCDTLLMKTVRTSTGTTTL